MIICKYEELKKYEKILPKLKFALECVEKLRQEEFPTGRYDYEGGFLFVQRGTTKPFDENAYETHEKYIDVQYMIKGGEKVYYEPVEKLAEYKAYDPEADIAFFTGKREDGTITEVKPGMCWVAYPEDAHMPCRYQDQPGDYLKIVMKLPVE